MNPLIATKVRAKCVCVYVQLQQQQSRLMKINHDLRHKISVVEAQGKALIEQKVELEASAQARDQEVGALRQEVTRLRERLQGLLPAEEAPAQPPSPAEVELPCEVESMVPSHCDDFYWFPVLRCWWKCAPANASSVAVPKKGNQNANM